MTNVSVNKHFISVSCIADCKKNESKQIYYKRDISQIQNGRSLFLIHRIVPNNSTFLDLL